MGKFNIERSQGKNTLVIQAKKGQQISEREYYAISNGLIKGLLRAELSQKGNSYKLSYNISGYISLREFLLNPLNKFSFARLIGDILNNLKTLQSSYFNLQYVLMDMDATMVNPSTHQVSFVYVPIAFYECGTSLKDFMLDIIKCCSFIQGEDTEYVRDYIRILNSGINFSVFDLEEYANRLNVDDRKIEVIKKCSRCGTVLQSNTNFCASCGFKILGNREENLRGIYDPAKNVAPSPDPVERLHYNAVETREQAAAFYQQNNAYHQQDTAKTSSDVFQTHQHNIPCLYRVKTNEKIQIVKDLVKIGKDPHGCDICISDNSAISRCHAVIKFDNGKWVVIDMNSTNKTFVNDIIALPNIEIELHNGVTIKFANEDFVFYLN